MFPAQVPKALEPPPTHKPNMSRRRVENAPVQRKNSVASDDFGDADLDDDALVKATCGDFDFDHIDNFADPEDAVTRSNTAKNKPAKEKGHSKAPAINNEDSVEAAPIDGKWSCNHKCKNKEACKHYCCKHGMDKPPKKAAPKRVPTDEHPDPPPPKSPTQRDNKTQTKLQLQASKRKSSAAIEELDLTQQEKKRKTEYAISGPRDFRELHNLHKNVQRKGMPASLHSAMKKKPAYCYSEGGEHQLSFLSHPATERPKTSSEYGDLQIDDFATEPSAHQYEPTDSDELTSLHFSSKTPVISRGSETFGDDDSMFDEAIVGLADSRDLRVNAVGTSSMQNHEARDAIDITEDFADIDFPVDFDFAANGGLSSDLPKQMARTTDQQDRHAQSAKSSALFFVATSSPEQPRHFKPAKTMLQGRELHELQQGKSAPSQPSHATNNNTEEDDVYSDLLNMLDVPLAHNKENIASVHTSVEAKSPVRSIETKKEEPKQMHESFKDLQPWLLQEFGDIVELVDE